MNRVIATDIIEVDAYQSCLRDYFLLPLFGFGRLGSSAAKMDVNH